MNPHPLLLAAVLAVALAACDAAPAATSLPDAPDVSGLVVEWGCGRGLWLGNEAGTVALRLQPGEDGRNLAVGSTYPVAATGEETAWSGALLTGRDLYANWCDDVIEENEPEPVVDEEWRLVAGTVEPVALPPGVECGQAEAWVRELVVESADGVRVEIGDLLVGNDTWGCFAG